MTARTPRRQTTGSVVSRGARALAVGVTLAAMSLVGMTGVAHARPVDGPDDMAARRPPTEGQVGKYWRNRPVTSAQQASADAALRRQLARERFSVPSQAPAQEPAPGPSASSAQSGWLVASLVALGAVLVLSIGLALRVARRANRRVRAGPAA
jgi:hypothetical protein